MRQAIAFLFKYVGWDNPDSQLDTAPVTVFKYVFFKLVFFLSVVKWKNIFLTRDDGGDDRSYFWNFISK